MTLDDYYKAALEDGAFDVAYNLAGLTKYAFKASASVSSVSMSSIASVSTESSEATDSTESDADVDVEIEQVKSEPRESNVEREAKRCGYALDDRPETEDPELYALALQNILTIEMQDILGLDEPHTFGVRDNGKVIAPPLMKLVNQVKEAEMTYGEYLGYNKAFQSFEEWLLQNVDNIEEDFGEGARQSFIRNKFFELIRLKKG